MPPEIFGTVNLRSKQSDRAPNHHIERNRFCFSQYYYNGYWFCLVHIVPCFLFLFSSLLIDIWPQLYFKTPPWHLQSHPANGKPFVTLLLCATYYLRAANDYFFLTPIMHDEKNSTTTLHSNFLMTPCSLFSAHFYKIYHTLIWWLTNIMQRDQSNLPPRQHLHSFTPFELAYR